MKTKKARKFRRLNLYTCKECGHPRGTLIYKRQQDGLCRKCAKNKVPENQPSLFIGIDPANDKKDYTIATVIDTDLINFEPAQKIGQKILEKYASKQAKYYARHPEDFGKNFEALAHHEEREIINIAFSKKKK